MGGMQALEWAVALSGVAWRRAIPIATTARHSAQQIAFNEVGRQAIMADPDWNDGNYYGKQPPARGLAVARMVGHITYMSDESMREKFGRRLRDKENFSFDFDVDFEVESYLRYRGNQFVDRFDANSYLYITKAMDYFDLTAARARWPPRSKRARTRFLVISFTSRLAVSELSIAGDRARAARAQSRRGLLRSAIATTATIRSWWTWPSRPSWCADSWRARSRRRNESRGFVSELLGRSDFAIIGEIVEPGTRVLDLGCGEGELLAWLTENKHVDARGVEMSGAKVQQAIARGVSVYQGDINEGLADYPDQAFDYVILSQTLQETQHPRALLRGDAARRPPRDRGVSEFRALARTDEHDVERPRAASPTVSLRLVRFAEHSRTHRARLRRPDRTGEAGGGAAVFSDGSPEGRSATQFAGRSRRVPRPPELSPEGAKRR